MHEIFSIINKQNKNVDGKSKSTKTQGKNQQKVMILLNRSQINGNFILPNMKQNEDKTVTIKKVYFEAV